MSFNKLHLSLPFFKNSKNLGHTEALTMQVIVYMQTIICVILVWKKLLKILLYFLFKEGTSLDFFFVVITPNAVELVLNLECSFNIY